MTAAIPAAAYPQPHFPYDQSDRGLPLPWYYFEQSLECALKQEFAATVLQHTRNELIHAVASDAYIAMSDQADICWSSFHRYAPL